MSLSRPCLNSAVRSLSGICRVFQAQSSVVFGIGGLHRPRRRQGERTHWRTRGAATSSQRTVLPRHECRAAAEAKATKAARAWWVTGGPDPYRSFSSVQGQQRLDVPGRSAGQSTVSHKPRSRKRLWFSQCCSKKRPRGPSRRRCAPCPSQSGVDWPAEGHINADALRHHRRREGVGACESRTSRE